MTSESVVTREKLVSDLKVVVADAEELVRASAGQAGERLAAARERLQASLAEAKTKLAEAERVLVQKTRDAARATDAYVHENPWQAVGVAALVGFVIGLLVGRR
jgi:ElaB/YqjD/DUF883 family membrane-anchored ribosome-binding protein